MRPARRNTRRPRPTALRCAIVAALLLPGLQSAQAVNYTWIGNAQISPTSWVNALNWAGTLLPLQGDDTGLLFPNTFLLANNDIAAGFRLNRIRAFDNGGTGGIGTIAGQLITLAGVNPELFVGAAGTLALNAPLSGALAFSKTGAGELNLGGSNLGLTGDFNIAAGRVSALNGGNLGTGAITLASGAALRTGSNQFIAGISGSGSWQADGLSTLTVASGERSFAGAITGNGAFTKGGNGRQVFTGVVASGGPVTVGAGELALSGAPARWTGATALTVANAATASVNGGAQWTVNGGVNLGGGSALVGSGTLAIGPNSRFTSSSGLLGEIAGDRGSATVASGGRWTTAGALVVGQGGTGRFSVEGVGATASALTATLGVLPGSNGTLVLDQSGSFAAGLSLQVGGAGQGTVNVLGGGLLSAASASVGQSAGGNGVVTLNGSASRWTTSGAMTVGALGEGRVSLDAAQGTVGAGMVLGAEAIGAGTLQLANAATWGVTGGLVVGQRGTGIAEVASGAVLTTQGAAVGLAGGAGEVNIRTSGQWVNNGNLVIGSGSQGWLFLASGAGLSTGNTTVGLLPLPGNPPSPTGNVIADAANWTVNGELRLADAGTARMDLTGGTQLQSTTAVLAERTGSTARVLVAGSDTATTRWNNMQGFVVGKGGAGELTLSGRAALVTGPASLGSNGGSGLVVMDNSGTNVPSWIVLGSLAVGEGGGGAITLADGSLSSGAARIGTTASGSGSVTVSSPQADWRIGGDLTIGGMDTGRIGGLLVVNQGGVVSSTGTAFIQPNGVLTLASNSQLSVADLGPNVGGRLNWTGGTLAITGPQGATLGSTAYLGRVLSLTGDQTLAVTTRLEVGSGTLVLSDSATVRAGTIALDGGQIVGQSVLELGSSGIQGHGIVGIRTLRGTADARVRATGGTLTVGNANAVDGFGSDGLAIVDPGARLMLMAAGPVALGRATIIEGAGTLQTLNGARLPAGNSLLGLDGALVLGRFTNDGTVGGPTAAGQVLSFNDNVDGTGSFTGQVRFLQGFAPQAGVVAQTLQLADTATLALGGLGAVALRQAPLQVTELAQLGGTLSLAIDAGFLVPAEGAVLELIDWGQFSGSFASFTVAGLDPAFTAQLSYGSDALRLNITAVPEPATWMVMLLGVAALLARRRMGRERGSLAG